MRRFAWIPFLSYLCCLVFFSSCNNPWERLSYKSRLYDRCLIVINESSSNYTVGELWPDYDTGPGPNFAYYIRLGEDVVVSEDTILFHPYQLGPYLSFREMEDDEELEVLVIDKDLYTMRLYKPKTDAYADECIRRVLCLTLKDLETCDFTIIINDELLSGATQ